MGEIDFWDLFFIPDRKQRPEVGDTIVITIYRKDPSFSLSKCLVHWEDGRKPVLQKNVLLKKVSSFIPPTLQRPAFIAMCLLIIL